MALSMLREMNGSPLLHNNNETNGSDTVTSKLNASATNQHTVTQQTHEPSEKVIHETTANGSDTPQPKLKSEDKTTQDSIQQTPSTLKAGTSPPTEHKQHLHLPLRKRHLLASSTGSHHNDNLGDINHTISTQITGQAQDGTTNNTSTDPEPHQANMTITKLVDPTHTEHTDPPEPPEPPETVSGTTKHPPTEHPPLDSMTKVVNGNRNTQEHKTKNEYKDFHDNNQDTLTHSLPGINSLHQSNQAQYFHHKRPQYLSQTAQHAQFNTHQPLLQQPVHSTAHSLQSSPHSQISHPHSQHHSHPQSTQIQQSKPPPTHAHSSPIRTDSPTETQSPTRAPSPSSQPARHSSSRGRGSGRGRGKTTKAEGLSASAAHASNTSSGEELYCFCRRPYDPTVDVFMICCDSCDEWYHGSCVGVNQREAKKIARYVCPRCKKMPTSPPTTTSATSSEVSSEGEPSTPPTSTKHKKRKNEASFKTEPKRQALSPEAITMSDNGVDAASSSSSSPSPSPSPSSLGQEESRYCLNCNKLALPKSKYCGQDCGLEYARKQYHNNGTSKKPTSATEVVDKEVLDEIARKKADIAEKLAKLVKEQRDLEKAIQFAKKMDSVSSPPSNVIRSTSPTALDADEAASKNHIMQYFLFDFSKAPPSENTTIDCISCGHPIAELIQSDMERCYHKKENNVLMVGTTADGGATYCNAYDSKSKTFCKKLKNGCALHAVKRASVNGSDAPTPANMVGSSLGVAGNGGGAHPPNSNPHQHHHAAPSHRRSTPPHTCGCPTGDFQSGYCELSRKACVKHHNWEELMRDSISNQRTQHNKILSGLEADEHAVRLRMARRSQATISSYRTIEEA